MVFFSSHVRIWELDHKEGKAPKNRCFQTVVLEKALENPLDYMGIQPVHPKGNQPWILIGRTDAKAPIVLWPLDLRTDSLGKTLRLAKIEGRSRRGGQRMSWLEGIIDSVDMVWANSRSQWGTGRLACAAAHRVTKSWTRLRDWHHVSYVPKS